MQRVGKLRFGALRNRSGEFQERFQFALELLFVMRRAQGQVFIGVCGFAELVQELIEIQIGWVLELPDEGGDGVWHGEN